MTPKKTGTGPGGTGAEEANREKRKRGRPRRHQADNAVESAESTRALFTIHRRQIATWEKATSTK